MILKVYEVLGNEIDILVSQEKSTGTYEIKFNIGSHSGLSVIKELPSGVYFYQLKAAPSGGQAGDYVETKKMILLR